MAVPVGELVGCCCRTGATLEGSIIIQAALPKLPQLYVPDVESLDQMCTKLQDRQAPIRFLEIVGAPGRGKLALLLSHSTSMLQMLTCLAVAAGKLTAAIAVVRHAVMTLHWATGYCAPFQVRLFTRKAAHPVAVCLANDYHGAQAAYHALQGVTSIAEAKFQLMGAFGIPADTQDMSPLYAWLRRNADLPFGLIMHNVDGMLHDVAVKQQFCDILANITTVRLWSQLYC